MKIEVRTITEEDHEALSLPNDPFPEGGRLIPMFDGFSWSYRIEPFPPEEVKENCFPNESYDYDHMWEGFYGFAVYADGECAGYALLRSEWNRWLYLDNLLVRKSFRRKGLASALIKACMEKASALGKVGMWLVCQDNNLGALRFYLNNGFTIGGMNQRVYEGTSQEGKTDIYLFKNI